MSKQTILFCISASAIAIALVGIIPRLLDGLMFFLLAGIIPGTTHTIGAGWMFVISMGLIGFIVANLIARYVLRNSATIERTLPDFTDNLPWKRFTQI